MITNNQFLKLKDRSSESIAKCKEVLLSMDGKIECLLDIKVEKDIRNEAPSYDLIVITKFASMEDMEAYIVNPIHMEVGKYIGEVFDGYATVCYES